jgi:hypothetical protein
MKEFTTLVSDEDPHHGEALHKTLFQVISVLLTLLLIILNTISYRTRRELENQPGGGLVYPSDSLDTLWDDQDVSINESMKVDSPLRAYEGLS